MGEQRHGTVALPEKKSSRLTEKAEWTPESDKTILREEKLLARYQNKIRQSFIPLAKFASQLDKET